MWLPIASGEALQTHWPGLLSGMAEKVAHWFFEHPDQVDINFVEASLYAWVFVMPIMTLVCVLGTRNMKRVPSGLQNILEGVVQALDGFTHGVINPKYASRFATYIGVVFLYIFVVNAWGLVPGMQAASSILSTTCALALCTFVVTHYTGLRYSGPKEYFKHFLGEPLWLAPLMFALHMISEIVRPVTLALRLRGNIGGEETAIAVFVSLGIMTGLFLPFQLPMMALGLFGSFIQALIFSVLSAVYIDGALPHHEHH